MARDLILQMHSFTGIAVFIIGLLQLVLKKGGKRHVILGQCYIFGWFALLLTGAYLGGPLITLIGIFGFYFALTGSRIAKLKNKDLQLFDKITILVSIVVMISILYYGIKLFAKGNTSAGIVFMVFGLLFLLTLQKDLRKYVGIGPTVQTKYGKLDWYFEHLNRMSISFIAAVTAFTSIQNVFRNNTLNFLLPTAIGLILITFFVKRLSKKMSNN
ncbi:MAG: hypothetical protein KDC34_17350 [Saprospiraceae bacterium]|nr:hypothetical protein [Saprospiraceae bacterium]